MKHLTLACVFGALLLFGAVASAQSPPPREIPEQGWQTDVLATHPLVGRLYDVKAGRFIDRATLIASLKKRDFILLGERHDHPDHHHLQARLVDALGQAKGGGTVAFEMLSDDQADALPDRVESQNGSALDLAALGDALSWESRGWPSWSLYQPIFEAALSNGMDLVPGGPAKNGLMQVAHGGLAALLGDMRKGLILDQPMVSADRDRLLDQIEAAHCGYAKRARLGPMLDAQRLKDAQMAARLMTARDRPAILIAGTGHTRGDWGVPHYLRARGAEGAAIAVVDFEEVRTDHTAPEAYGPRDAAGAPAVDYLWFTPRVDDVDPCEKFKSQLEKMGRKPAE